LKDNPIFSKKKKKLKNSFFPPKNFVHSQAMTKKLSLGRLGVKNVDSWSNSIILQSIIIFLCFLFQCDLCHILFKFCTVTIFKKIMKLIKNCLLFNLGQTLRNSWEKTFGIWEIRIWQQNLQYLSLSFYCG